jgi:FkbM family methyltransferase
MVIAKDAGPARDGWRGDGWLSRAYLGYARHVPPHPSKIRMFRWLAGALFSHGLPLRGYGNVRMIVDPRDYIGHEICFSRAYEPLSIALARRLMEHGGTFLDVGANFGLYTCAIAELPGVECIAVDASAIAFSKLQENLALNPGHAVRAVNVALASRRDLVSLETPVVGNLGTTRVADRANVQPDRGAYVAAMPLGEVLERLSAEPIRLIKIDVEGYEIEVFRGMDFAGRHSPEHIIMEYSERLNSDSHDLAGCYHLLESQGYVPYTVTGQPFTRNMPAPLPEENLWWRRA